MFFGLLFAVTWAVCAADYPGSNEHDSSYVGYRSAEPSHEENRYDEPISHEASFERSPSPMSDSKSYHLYHRDHPAQIQDQPQQHPEHHHHDHGTSSMSFYQKIKHHEHKFKFDQKHGKHGSFHGYAHPYAYGGLKVHDW